MKKRGYDILSFPPGSLFDFMVDKIKSYVEPQRKGTPRGEKIGFPLKKYVATLYVGLTKLTLKEVAEVAGGKFGFSYSLLRKWSSEVDFRKQKVTHCCDYLSVLCKINAIYSAVSEYPTYSKLLRKTLMEHFEFLIEKQTDFSKEAVIYFEILEKQRNAKKITAKTK